MDDLEPVPASDLPESPQGEEVPAHDLPATAASPTGAQEVPAADLPESLGGNPETSTLGAAAEGVAKGLAGPLATGAELGLSKLGVPGLSAGEQAQRQAEHPYAEGIGEAAGLIGGAFIPGVGEYTLGSSIAKAGAAATKSAEIGKVGQMALKLGIEGGLFHLSDNVSKMILGQTDPEAPVASLLAGVPAAALLGGALGGVAGKAAGKLQDIANGRTANTASQWLADLGSRFDVLAKHGGLEGTTEAASDQAQHLFDTVSAAAEDGFELKRNSIEKLTADITPEKTNQFVGDTLKALQGVAPSMKESRLYQEALEEWTSKAMPGEGGLPTAADVFEATDDLKKKLQYWSKFEKRVSDPNQLPFVNGSKKLSSFLKGSLENADQWGEMGIFQKSLNEAYSELQGPLKDFTRAATQSVNGEAQVDKGKLFNIFRQVGRGNLSADIRTDKVANFFDPARKFLNTVADLHASQGLESNIPPVSTNILDEMLQKNVGGGAKVGHWLFDSGQTAAGMAGSHIVGTAVGAAVGHPYLGYRAGEALFPLLKEMGKKPTRWAVGAALRALSAGEYSAIPEALNYAQGINNGANRIEGAVNNVFNIGGKNYIDSTVAEKDREKLKKYVENGSLNQQIQNQGKAQPSAQVVPQGFAHGGEVLAPEPTQPVHKPVGKALDGMGKLSSVFPEQAMLLGAAKGRINNYLNSIRPQKLSQKHAFDEEMPNKEHERSYDRAIDIANNPLSVLHHVKNGTLEPEHMEHMKQLYPELTNHLQKKITEKITEAQIKNEKPPYKVRQGLSLFMGSALDANLTPQNIMAAQSTFMAQKAAPQPGISGKPKKGTASLENEPNQYRTSSQAAQLRQSRIKS